LPHIYVFAAYTPITLALRNRLLINIFIPFLFAVAGRVINLQQPLSFPVATG